MRMMYQARVIDHLLSSDFLVYMIPKEWNLKAQENLKAWWNLEAQSNENQILVGMSSNHSTSSIFLGYD
jgi:hypothetical protein